MTKTGRGGAVVPADPVSGGSLRAGVFTRASVSASEGNASREAALAVAFAYTARGLTKHTDELGHVTRFVHDAAGRLLSQTNANDAVAGIVRVGVG